MCHQTVRPSPSTQSRASDQLAASPVQGDTGLETPADERDQDQDNSMVGQTQSESVAAQESTEQPGVDGRGAGDDGGKPVQPAEPNEGVRGLCFSSTGDFVRFSSPVSCCSSSQNVIHSHMLRQNPSHPDTSTQGEEDSEAAPCPSSLGALNGNIFEVQSDYPHAKSDAAACPDNDSGHERTEVLNSTHPNGHEKTKMSEVGSLLEISELLNHVDESHSGSENGTHSHSPQEPPPCPR